MALIEEPKTPTNDTHEPEDEEEIEWEVGGEEEEEAKVTLGVMAKIWTDRNINSNALIATMRKIWNPKHGMEANCLEKNMFFFQFHHWRDKEFVMEAQPWHFDKHILALSDVQGDLKPSEYPLHLVPFWVRVYDLPILGRNNESNARKIGNKVGCFMKVDKSDIVGINKSLRIRVSIDVRKPLKEEIDLKLRGGVLEKVQVKYEKLQVFCYFCGKLGHGEKDCEANSDPRQQDYMYIEKLRASPWIVNKGLGNKDRREEKSCARKLFVTKQKPPHKEVDKEAEKGVELVVEKLGGVSLSLEKGVANIHQEKSVKEGERNSAAMDNRTEATATDSQLVEGNPLSFHIGSSVPGGRKFRRVKRSDAKENGIKDTGQVGYMGDNGGKRKDLMEVDGCDFQKCTKMGEEEGQGPKANTVAVVAVQPREQQ
ncbi:uncharacterized protein [Spinacia oleracea]|uniref:CCHC-type domain-containing protein n=1 Tax=Spinacia oleracea TaxID=3562 RepID=A0A9R0J075_SPIOL|nr:uncharacterized protein LOC110798083 [Spinacia oleracea]